MNVNKFERIILMLSGLVLMTLSVAAIARATPEADSATYLPIVLKPEPQPMQEFRGLWVSRYDWTLYGQPANSAKLDEIVQNAALAGFNVIFFQVRGTADAYYTPGLEPWAQRVSGVALGQPPDPMWDPLAYLIAAAHTAGIQVHAYLNVYPVWDDCDTPPPNTAPTHFYYLLRDYHLTTAGKLNGLQWYKDETVLCNPYLRATPASSFGDKHYLDVAEDLVTRYDIDGIHLDNIRYGASNASYDPVSADNYDDTYSYDEWQRRQVNSTVRKFYEQIVPLKAGLWLSAAVWPIHIVDPAWGFPGHPQQGYSTYFQDSKVWLADNYIDSISPMIYPNTYNECDADGNYIEDPDDEPAPTDYWLRVRWQTLVADYQMDGNGRYIIPGIGAGYCNFDEIEARIDMARQIGTAGHAIFSYRGLLAGDYFDDFAAGPYAVPAVVPEITWHP